jgi:RNA polymerase sigma factor (sigma-70 family)
MKTNELLRRYVKDRSEPAFEELVGQYIDLVYSAALRQVGGDVPAAQDVTQAVFSELARHAPRLLRHTSLTGWLYTSTRFLAAKARRSEQRRRSREQEAHEMNQLLHPTDPDPAWHELRPLLDDAMHELSTADRETILMRYFERLPLAEIGARLGLKENAAHMRIERAIGQLRKALAKRGVTSKVTALTLALSGRAVGAAPAGLATQVSRAALATVAAGSGLGWGLLKLTGLTKGKLLLATGGAAVVAGLILVPQLLPEISGTRAAKIPGPTRAQDTTPGVPPDSAVAGAINPTPVAQSPASNKLALRIVADDNGRPIPEATIEFMIREKNTVTRELLPKKIIADDLGACEVPVSADKTDLLIVRTRVDGFVDTSFTWSPERGETVPRKYTLRVARSVPIGGRVEDEDSKPVAGAEVAVQTTGNSASEDDPSPPHISTQAGEKTITDMNGRWRIDRFARTDISEVHFRVNDPDYVSDPGIVYANNPVIEQQRLNGTYVYTLARAMAVRGIVVGEDGQPVSGAKVTIRSGSYSQETTNEPDGTFILAACKAGTNQITTDAPGFALATLSLELTNHETPLRLALRRGNQLRLRVVDTNGLPVPNATVRLNFVPAAAGTGEGLEQAGLFNKRTDAEGRIVWNSAPAGGLFFGIEAGGFQSAINIQVAADGVEHLLTLHASRSISGSVRDAALGRPIPRFRIVTGEMGLPGVVEGTNVSWGQSQIFRDGTFHYVDDNPSLAAKYKFEADGYAPFITRVVGRDEGEVSFDIVLAPAFATTITVLLQNGQPATHLSIGLDISGTSLFLTPDGFSPPAPGNYNNVFFTDNGGQFVLPSDATIGRVIAAGPDGYAEATPDALAAEPTLHLRPWGRLEGRVLSGGKPAVGRALSLGQAGPRLSTMYPFFHTETDAEGHFAFPKVPPGSMNLFEMGRQDIFRGVRLLPIPALTIKPGEATTLVVPLYNVTAQLGVPAGAGVETNRNIIAVLSRTQPLNGRPLKESLKESDDGTWVAEDLPAGDYTLWARSFKSTHDGGASKIDLEARMTFTVQENAPGGAVDLGKIVLQPVQ